MPRQIAPPPSGEFSIVLTKPFSGSPTYQVEVIGEPNRSAVAKVTQHTGSAKSSQKSGDVPKDDVNELMALISAVRGFPSHQTEDVYGLDTKLDFTTFDIQWSNQDEDPMSNEINELAGEQKDEFKRVADSIEALGRAFAKKDSAI